MIKANDTIFRFYLAIMDSFSDYLSEKYPENSSIDDTKHYQTAIIKRIVQMFYSLELLTKDTLDEVSARCVLRGILDSVTIYCFIYKREDYEEILFRHYLYVLDGFSSYRDHVIKNDIDYNESNSILTICDDVISQIEHKLLSHPYSSRDNTVVAKIIESRNWKYRSFQNQNSVKFGEMYTLVNFENRYADYCKSYLSQHAHGLCFSNRIHVNREQMKKVLFESIPIADKFIQSITQTFCDKSMIINFFSSGKIKTFLDSRDFDVDNLFDFAKALIRKDKIILT